MRQRESMLAVAALLALAAGCGKKDPGTTPEGKAGSWPPAVTADEVAVTKADQLQFKQISTVPADNPYAKEWKEAPYVEVPLQPQQMTVPRLPAASVEKAKVQALTDGKSVSIRVAWPDAVPEGNVDAGRFVDAVAVELPISEGTPQFMGAKGKPVQILHWKALWQKDVDVHFQDVQDVHPNYWSDLYWFAEGKFPFPVPASFKNPASLQWFVAHQAGNPMAVFSRKSPVEELTAEGWGSLTHQPRSATTAKGAWTKGTWAVVFTRALKTDDPADHQFGQKGELAIAVWNGGGGNVGARKHWSNWVPFEVKP
ncbi:MAG: hypothetical protein IT371_21075 [Deltaproteobacteria bacterium]|nr:hypothetical protein [Deltaproteobacteria bacterium]